MGNNEAMKQDNLELNFSKRYTRKLVYLDHAAPVAPCAEPVGLIEPRNRS